MANDLLNLSDIKARFGVTPIQLMSWRIRPFRVRAGASWEFRFRKGDVLEALELARDFRDDKKMRDPSLGYALLLGMVATRIIIYFMFALGVGYDVLALCLKLPTISQMIRVIDVESGCLLRWGLAALWCHFFVLNWPFSK